MWSSFPCHKFLCLSSSLPCRSSDAGRACSPIARGVAIFVATLENVIAVQAVTDEAEGQADDAWSRVLDQCADESCLTTPGFEFAAPSSAR
jgi:hypothetical protein